MIEYFSNNQDTFWFVLGFLLLAIEGMVLGMTTGVILFSGLGALITGALMWFTVLPQTWVFGIASFAICSTLTIIALWKPLKMLQKDNDGYKDKSSDFIGHTFRLDTDITPTTPGKTRYSGIEWRVDVDGDQAVALIAAGEKVKVSGVSSGVFEVVRDA